MATDWPNDAQTPLPRQVDALRMRGVLSPRSIRRSGLGRLSGSAERSEYGRDQAQGGGSFTFGPGPRSAAEAGWLHSDEGRNRPGEYGAAYQDLARAHMADDATEAAFQRFNSAQYGDRRMGRDESDRRNRGAISSDHLDSKTHQAGGSAYGRKMSAGGGVGREVSPAPDTHINAARNQRQQPEESTVRASNRDSTPRSAHWLLHYESRAMARKFQANEYFPGERGVFEGDPPHREARQQREIFDSAMR